MRTSSSLACLRNLVRAVLANSLVNLPTYIYIYNIYIYMCVCVRVCEHVEEVGLKSADAPDYPKPSCCTIDLTTVFGQWRPAASMHHSGFPQATEMGTAPESCAPGLLRDPCLNTCQDRETVRGAPNRRKRH